MKRSPMPARTTAMSRTEWRRSRCTSGGIPAGARGDVYYRSQGRCEVLADGCAGAGSELHHRLRRSQGGGHDPDNLLHVCGPCHRFIHANPAVAFDNGWLIHAGAVS